MKEFIIWDFDGVIIDSDEIRENGFRRALAKFDKSQVDQLIKYHRENGGLSRYHKFEYFFNKIGLDENLIQENTKEALFVFGELMKNSLCDTSLLIKENLERLKVLSLKSKMFIASGSDNSELNQLCQCLNIDSFFKGIYGSPTPKTQIVESLLANWKENTDSWVLIGDSINDYEAATNANIDFIGYRDKRIIELSTITFNDIL